MPLIFEYDYISAQLTLWVLREIFQTKDVNEMYCPMKSVSGDLQELLSWKKVKKKKKKKS